MQDWRTHTATHLHQKCTQKVHRQNNYKKLKHFLVAERHYFDSAKYMILLWLKNNNNKMCQKLYLTYWKSLLYNSKLHFNLWFLPHLACLWFLSGLPAVMTLSQVLDHGVSDYAKNDSHAVWAKFSSGSCISMFPPTMSLYIWILAWHQYHKIVVVVVVDFSLDSTHRSYIIS